jgi:DNA-directed RNA polymerase specialized sigma24 family protein
MRPARPSPLVAMILAESSAAVNGARYGRCPERDVDDVVQEALAAACHRAQLGIFYLPTNPEKHQASIRSYLFTCAKREALMRRRKLSRTVYCEDLPESFIDPWPRLDARAVLRELPEPLHMRALYETLAAGDSVMDYIRASGTKQGTAYNRLERLRKLEKRRRK